VLKDKQQRKAVSWRQMNLKHNNHLKKEKFMAVAHIHPRDIDKSL
jgi:hypothetical protein